MDKKADVFDMGDYHAALSVTKDFPVLIREYERLLTILDAYSHYSIAWEVREVILDNLSLAKIHLELYSHIKNTKGIVK